MAMTDMECVRLLLWLFSRLRERSRMHIRRYWDRAELALLLKKSRGIGFIVLRTRLLYVFLYVPGLIS